MSRALGVANSQISSRSSVGSLLKGVKECATGSEGGGLLRHILPLAAIVAVEVSVMLIVGETRRKSFNFPLLRHQLSWYQLS